MATLNLTPEKFADIAMIWLFDHVMNPEQVKNEKLKEFLETHRGKLRPSLIQYYLNTNTNERVGYKRIKDVFEGEGKTTHQIRIGPDKQIEESGSKKDSTIKRLARQAVSKKVQDGQIEREEGEILFEYIANCVVEEGD